MSLTRTFALVLLPTLTFGAVVLTGSIEPLRAAGRAAPTVSLSGVMVSDVVDASDANLPERAFRGTQHGTCLALLVGDPGAGIVGFDRDASAVEAFVDSTGRSLLDPDSEASPFGFTERLLGDSGRLALELSGARTPADRATWVQARGAVAVTIAHHKASWSSDRVSIEAGATIRCGPYTFQVTRAETPRPGEGLELELRTRDAAEHVTSWALVDGDAHHELRRSSTMSFDGTSRITLRCPVAPGAAALLVEAWTDPRAVRVPFSLKARVGEVR
ncbi:MAG: hypothetical protein VX460_07090 [Planctomycetota bacterium]|nr:hypothetical protein [Planctomycetota bacterium]